MKTSDLKQIYFTLDYLRLHKLGRKLKLFNKNRQMIDSSAPDDPKKGYKAYIHRMYHTFLKKDFNYVTVVKPRNEFGYNFGPTENQLNNSEFTRLNILKNPENALLYAFRRYFLYKDHEDLVQSYIQSYAENKYVKPRTKGMFYTVRLNPLKSGGFDAMKELYKVRDAHLKILDNYSDSKAYEECMQKSIASILNKIRKVKRGQTVLTHQRNGSFDPNISGVIDTVLERRNPEGFVEYVDIIVGGRSFSLRNTQPIFVNQSKDFNQKLEEIKAFKEAFLNYALTRLDNSKNLTVNQVFDLSKAFYKIEKSLTEDELLTLDSLSSVDFEAILSPDQKAKCTVMTDHEAHTVISRLTITDAVTRDYVDDFITNAINNINAELSEECIDDIEL